MFLLIFKIDTWFDHFNIFIYFFITLKIKNESNRPVHIFEFEELVSESNTVEEIHIVITYIMENHLELIMCSFK